MPTAKPTQVIVHRIELQKTERDMLEAAVMTNAVAKVGQAAGAILTPFAGALTAIIAGMLAKATVEDIAGWVNEQLAEKESVLSNAYAGYLDAASRALNARYPEGHPNAGELMVPADHPSRARPPMTRAEFDEIYEREAMTNWERMRYNAAELGGPPGWIVGSDEFHDSARSRRSNTWNCEFMMGAPFYLSREAAQAVCAERDRQQGA
jgi:hypothetical protein